MLACLVSTKAIIKEVQLVEAETKLLKDFGKPPEAKVVEDLIRYELDELSSDRYFLIISNLKERQRIELIKFLKAGIRMDSIRDVEN